MRQGWIRRCGLIQIILGLITGGVLAADEVVLSSATAQTGKYARESKLSGPTADLRSNPHMKKAYLGL